MLNNYFSTQTRFDDDNKHVPSLPRPQQTTLSSIVIAYQDVFELESSRLLSPLFLTDNLAIVSSHSLAKITDLFRTPPPPHTHTTPHARPSSKTTGSSVHKHLYNYLVDHQLPNPFQSDFLLQVILLLTSKCITIILLLKRVTVEKKSELSSVI